MGKALAPESHFPMAFSAMLTGATFVTDAIEIVHKLIVFVRDKLALL